MILNWAESKLLESVVAAGVDILILREGPEELLALCGRAVQRFAWDQARERVRDIRREEIDGRLVPFVARREVLPRHRIHVEVGRQIVAAAGDVGALDEPQPRQLALHANRPSHRLAVDVVEVVVEAAKGSSNERVGSEAVARRRGHAIRERVGQRRANREAGVGRWDDVGGLREPGLVDAADVEERGHRVDRPAAANDSFRIQLIREAGAWLEVIDVGQRCVAFAVAGKHQAATDAELRRRDLRNRIGRVGRLRRVCDRQRRVGIETARVAIVALGRRALVLPAQAEVDGQVRIHLPVVLEEDAAVDDLVEPIGAAIDDPAARVSQQHRRQILTGRRRGRVVELPRQHAVTSEVVSSGRVHAREAVFAVDAEVDARAEAVLSPK